MLSSERPSDEQRGGEAIALESPFLEAGEAPQSRDGLGFALAGEAMSPFATPASPSGALSETDHLLAEALTELRDEAFNESVAYLVEETETAVSERFTDEGPVNAEERERYAETYLAGVGFEAEQYLNTLEAGLTGLDIASLTEEQLEAKLDQFDPETGELSPAGEEFVGGLVRKAKKAVKFVANAAKGIGKIAGSLLSPVLGRLKALIRPLLRRVLALAIGRLPAPLQPVARKLASKLQLEGEDRFDPEAEDGEAEDQEGYLSPANLVDPESLAESFDAALAEAFAADGAGEWEGEAEVHYEDREREGRQLERLAEARGRLIDALRAGDEAKVGPAVEQFVPVLLGALKIGINLVGRSKVVGFLAGYLSKLIGRWVGPQLSGPLSNAIVDTGLRLVSLEAEDERDPSGGEAAPVALASVVEDTVRRFAEQEDYIFQNEELTELAAAEAFSNAVATHFPPQFVRPDLRQASTLGGTFVARRPRSLRSYRKYSRVPEIEVTPQIADALPSFGGTTLGRTLRAAGVAFPLKARMHIYQTAPGTTLPAIARTDRSLRAVDPFAGGFHPLTPSAAGLLLREPRLGTSVAGSFLRSPHRVAVGQRVYVLQPAGAMAGSAGATVRSARAAAARLAPGRVRVTVDRRRGRITVRLYLSEAESQRLASLIRAGRGHGALLQALVDAYRAGDSRAGSAPVLREDEQAFEDLVPGARPGLYRPRQRLAQRLRAWILPALAKWARANAEAFARAAAHPDSGVTVRIRLSSVPGLGRARGGGGAPLVAIAVASGQRA